VAFNIEKNTCYLLKIVAFQLLALFCAEPFRNPEFVREGGSSTGISFKLIIQRTSSREKRKA
jgi:hypothetical protein